MTCQQVKTFYWYFKPIALTCKVLGIFPLQNIFSSDEPRNLKWRMISLAHLYSLIIFMGNIFMIYYFAGFMFSTNKSIFIFLVIYVMIGRSIICFLFCESYSYKLPPLITLLDTFDRKKTSLLVEDNGNQALKSFILWTLLPMIIGFTTFAVFFIEAAQMVLETFPPEIRENGGKAAAFFFGWLSMWQVVPTLMYAYFALKISSNFNIINRTIRKRGFTACFFDDNVKYPEDMHLSMEYLRQMHNMMTKTVYEMGRFYGNFMAVDQLCIIGLVIVNICTFIRDRSNDLHLLIMTALNIIIMYVVLTISHRVKDCGTKVIDLLHGIVFSKVSDQCRNEIQTFMLQITVWPPEVSAAGFFILDKRQIPSVLSAIATYLIVTVQFFDEARLESMVSANCSSSLPK